MPNAESVPAAAIRTVRLPSADDVGRARTLVAAHLAPTPVVAIRLPGVDGEVLVKLESLQPTGSFKVRGALAALAAHTGTRSNDPPARVVTASAGNHALGIAFAADRLGVRATVVVPTTASPSKVAALQRMDVELIQQGATYEASERYALDLAEAGPDGTAFVSPYNDPHVIAGQSTMASEIGDQVGDDVTLVVPVGGGGLIAGAALWAQDHPTVHIVGVEAAASASVSAAVEAGWTVTVPVSPTLADGLGGNLEPGSITPAIAARRVDGFVQVGEDQIADAIRMLAGRCGLVAEGAAAVGVAALMADAVPVTGRPVVVLTGRNIAPALLAKLLDGARASAPGPATNPG